MNTNDNTIYYKATEKLKSEWIDANAVSHEFANGKGEIKLKDSVTEIGDSAFNYCRELISVVIPDSVTSIENYAFFNCAELTAIIIPDSETRIEQSAFGGCWGLTSITIKQGNPIYDSRDNCNAIIETATNKLVAGCMKTIIPDSVTEIGESAFDGCIYLTSINIPDSITKIGDGAFYGCSLLGKIKEKILKLNNLAFYSDVPL